MKINMSISRTSVNKKTAGPLRRAAVFMDYIDNFNSCRGATNTTALTQGIKPYVREYCNSPTAQVNHYSPDSSDLPLTSPTSSSRDVAIDDKFPFTAASSSISVEFDQSPFAPSCIAIASRNLGDLSLDVTPRPCAKTWNSEIKSSLLILSVTLPSFLILSVFVKRASLSCRLRVRRQLS